MAKFKGGKKGKVKGPVGGPAGVTAMVEGDVAEKAVPRPVKTTRASGAGYKQKMGKKGS